MLWYTVIMYLYWRDPGLLAERYQMPGTGNQEPWDRFVVYGIMAGLALTILLMARIMGEEALLSREREGYRD